jgi:hypothetical protein
MKGVHCNDGSKRQASVRDYSNLGTAPLWEDLSIQNRGAIATGSNLQEQYLKVSQLNGPYLDLVVAFVEPGRYCSSVL